MPWYNEKLDFDLEEKLNAMQLHNGIFLNLGWSRNSSNAASKERI